MTNFKSQLLEPWYDIVSALPVALGNTLIKMSTDGTGYDPRYTSEEWNTVLRKKGDILVAFGTASANGEVDYSEDELVVQEVKDVLHWVADNIETLWD